MNTEEIFECTLLSAHEGSIGMAELLRLSGLTRAELDELVAFGVFSPRSGTQESWVFSGHAVTLARTAGRLREHFDLNASGIALALTYLERIGELEARLAELECQILGR